MHSRSTTRDACPGESHAEFGQPGTKFTMRQPFVAGDRAFIVWEAETSANTFELASDTFVVRDGRIAVHTFAVSPSSTTPFWMRVTERIVPAAGAATLAGS